MMKKQKSKDNKRIFDFISKLGSRDERNQFIENLSMMIGSGMGISQSLLAIRKELRSSYMKRVINQVKEDIDSGSYVWKALKKTGILPGHIISLIKVGEESGRLAENLKVVAEQQEKEQTFNSKIRSAMLYPALVLSVTVVVGTGVTWFILPKLSSIFKSLDVDLPFLTKLLISFGNFLKDYGVIAVPTFAVFVFICVYFVFIHKKTKKAGEIIMLKIPGIKNLINQVEISRMGYITGTLIDAGIPIVKALESLKEASTVSKFKKLYKHLHRDIGEGKSIQESFANFKNIDKLIPKTIQQMIVSGEQSGNLSEMFRKVGKVYEAKIDSTTKNLVVLLEPIMLIIVWVGVVLIALAVIMPIYSLVGKLR